LTQHISNDELQSTIDAYTKYGSDGPEALGIGKSQFYRRLHLCAERGLLGYKPVLPGFRISKTTIVNDESGNAVREFIQQAPEHGDVFEMPDGHVAKGISALVDGEGRIIQQWIKTTRDTIIPAMVEACKTVFAEIDRATIIEPPAETFAHLCNVYPIADQHNGLVSWGRETGENYDLKIGAARLRSCMQRLVAQSIASRLAIIINLGDWQHTDDATNMTPGHSNVLDVDSRYFKILSAGIRLMKDCVDLALQKHKQVIVRNIPGNHDPHASIALTVALAEFYSNEPRVTIDQDPSDFFYYRFGETLMGATHGHKMKPDRMAMNMAVNRREDWGATKYHWFLFGHIHHETVREVGDVRVESFQSLSAKDAWSASHGYLSGQSLSSITLHKKDGEIGRHRINIAPPGNK
jgi:hypothetical protein